MNGGKVISEHESNHHTIVKYQFKKMDLDIDESSHLFESEVSTDIPNVKPTIETKENQIVNDESLNSTLSAEKLEDLMQSINNIENQFQSQNSKFISYFEEDKIQSYQNGIKEGKEVTQTQLNEEMNNIKTRLIEAIEHINTESSKLENSIKKLELELSSVAIDIAKQVIDNELSAQSQKIATGLAKSLIKDLSDATEILIKVHPDDYGYLKQNLSQDVKVKVEADNAIAKGGVVVVSDAGNIDGSIKERFSRVKSTLFED